MNERDKALKRYYRNICSLLPCRRKMKSAILRQMQENIGSYIAENPDTDFEQIQARFGAPEVIAASYVENTGTAEILKSLWVRRRIVTTAITIAIAILLSWAAVVTWVAVKAERAINGTTEVLIDVIEEETCTGSDPQTP